MTYEEKRFTDLKDTLEENGIPLIVTATSTETNAIHGQMMNLDDSSSIIQFSNGNYTYYMGKLGNYIIVHVECEMGAVGRGSSIMTVTKAIEVIKPKFVIMIGIAFGVDRKKQNIGDVLVSESIIPYNSKRVGAKITINRGKQGLAGKGLLNKFKNIRSWEYDLENEKKARIIYTDILSGETLVDNKEYRKQLTDDYPNAEGGEMEGVGVFAACDSIVQWILVKGICDYADGKKGTEKEKYQKIAIDSALNLCMELFNSKITFEELGVKAVKKKVLIERKYLPYHEAREIVRSLVNKKGNPLNMKTEKDWNRYYISQNKYDNIPKNPAKIYKEKGWIDWNDWLKPKKYRDYQNAIIFANSLGLENKSDWIGYCNGKWPSLPSKPKDIPDRPIEVYRKHDLDWSIWLTGKERLMNFTEARTFVRKLELDGQQAWKLYAKGELNGYEKKPKSIPTTPDKVYINDGWDGIADWLGYEGKIKPKKGDVLEDNWWSYQEAKNFVQNLNLKSSSQWNNYCNGKYDSLVARPDGIPRQPSLTYPNYGNYWTGWEDWLGTNTEGRLKDALPFIEARKYVRLLKLKSTKEWVEYKKGNIKNLEPIPKNIPKTPSSYYKDNGWNGMPDWLGY